MMLPNRPQSPVHGRSSYFTRFPGFSFPIQPYITKEDFTAFELITEKRVHWRGHLIKRTEYSLVADVGRVRIMRFGKAEGTTKSFTALPHYPLQGAPWDVRQVCTVTAKDPVYCQTSFPRTCMPARAELYCQIKSDPMHLRY